MPDCQLSAAAIKEGNVVDECGDEECCGDGDGEVDAGEREAVRVGDVVGLRGEVGGGGAKVDPAELGILNTRGVVF